MNTKEVVQEVNGNPFSFYWTFVKLKRAIVNFAREHKKAFLLLFSFAMFVVFMARVWIQPKVLVLRIYSCEILLVVGLLWGFWGTLKSRLSKKAYLFALAVSALIVWPHDYCALYLRHLNLDKQSVELLETIHERIQPLNSIRDSIGGQFNSSNYQYNEPYFVRGANGDYRWTTGKEPLGGSNSYLGGVEEVVSVSATDPTPNYSLMNNHVPVSFAVGEFLRFGKNAKICTIRSFGLLRFWSFEPSDVRYIEEANGKFVQVVSLIKWEGIIWPQPVFGGVQIIRQSDGGVGHFIKMMLVGDGEYIAPEDIVKYPFLRGQNLVPYKVSRYIAESFSFRNGILENVPWNNNGAIRIPDLLGDANDQPFALCFKNDKGEEKIYQHFNLQPSRIGAGGQAMSLWVQGDGIGPTLYYDNIEHKDVMIGVSSVGGNVRNVDEHIDWNNTQSSEHKPLIHKIMGRKRFLFMSTLVMNQKNTSTTSKNGKQEVSGEDYHAGGVPKITLTEPHIPRTIRVDALHRETWDKELEREFGSYWKETDPK